jgi:hypothetical protein
MDFPLDTNGNPLAWPDPDFPNWWIDAWNGIYDSRESALAESRDWVATEHDRVLSYGERLIDEAELERRKA